MQLIAKRNFIMLLAAILVVGFGLMSLYLDRKKSETLNPAPQEQLQKPMTNTDKIEDIEKDLDQTDFDSVEEELQKMDKEIDTL